MRLRIFVSGPLSSSGDREANVRVAGAIGKELARRGYAPFVPHLSHYTDPEDSIGTDAWYETDLAWLVSSDALVRFAGESFGADRERRVAERLGIPVAEAPADPIAAADAVDALRLARGDVRLHELLPVLGRLHDLAMKEAERGTNKTMQRLQTEEAVHRLLCGATDQGRTMLPVQDVLRCTIQKLEDAQP